MERAAVLWTGGKDSVLAMLEARERWQVDRLVTFVPEPARPFLAHPIECMEAQAVALGIPHSRVPVVEPLARSYETAIDALARDGIEVLVTGDIASVAGHDNWIVERARDVVRVERPLWGLPREWVLEQLLARGITAVCSLARRDAFEVTVVGRVFDREFIDVLCAREGIGGFDACGENGEYHTCVLDAPGFAHGLALRGARVETDGEFDHVVFDSIDPVRSLGFGTS